VEDTASLTARKFVAEKILMHCRRPKGGHRRALCLAMLAQPAGSNSEHLIWQDHLLFARRGPRRAAALTVSAAMLSGCSLASSVGSSDSSPSFASRFASFFSGATPGVTQPHSPTPSAPDVECPGVDIRTGASTMNIAAKTTDATAGVELRRRGRGRSARLQTSAGISTSSQRVNSKAFKQIRSDSAKFPVNFPVSREFGEAVLKEFELGECLDSCR
jgi:hypothetical protein